MNHSALPREAMMEADQNGDGKLDFEEFKAMVANTDIAKQMVSPLFSFSSLYPGEVGLTVFLIVLVQTLEGPSLFSFPSFRFTDFLHPALRYVVVPARPLLFFPFLLHWHPLSLSLLPRVGPRPVLVIIV